MNEQDLREAMRTEMGNLETSPIVEEKLRAAYEQVRTAPQAKAGGRRYRQTEKIWLKPLKAAAGALGTLAAAFVVLIGIGFANPALAAELPIIGGIFEQFRGKTGEQVPPSVNSKVIANAVPVDAVSSSVVDEASAVQIEVAEASCDGMTVNLALRMTCKDEKLNSMETTLMGSYAAGEEFSITANGVTLSNSFAYHPVFTMTETPGVYTGVLPVMLPEELRGAEKLDVHCELPTLRADSFPKNAAEKRPGDAQTKYLPVSWESDFSIDGTPDFKTYEPSVKFGGVTLEKVIVGQASIEYTVTMPAEMNSRAILNPLDDRGEVVSPHNRTNGGRYKDDEIKTIDVFISAPEHDTKTLTFRVADFVEADDETVEGDPESAELLGTYTLELD